MKFSNMVIRILASRIQFFGKRDGSPTTEES